MDEQPATTSSSIIFPSPTPEADEDTMTPNNFDKNFSVPTAENNDSLSKTAVIFIVFTVFAVLIVVAFAAHFYKKYGGDVSSNKARDKSERHNSYDDSDGTVSEDGSNSNA